MSDLVWRVVIGVLVGGIARFALPERNPGGLLLAAAMGVAGSMLASYVGERIGWYQAGDMTEFAMSAAGAIVLVTVFRFLSGAPKKRPRRDDDYDS